CSSLFALRSSLFALRSSLFALRSSPFALCPLPLPFALTSSPPHQPRYRTCSQTRQQFPSRNNRKADSDTFLSFRWCRLCLHHIARLRHRSVEPCSLSRLRASHTLSGQRLAWERH